MRQDKKFLLWKTLATKQKTKILSWTTKGYLAFERLKALVKNCPNLQKLFLDNNQIEKVSKVPPVSLKYLNLSYFYLDENKNVWGQILNLFFLTLYTIKWSENAIRLRESNFVYLSGIETQVTSIFCNWPTGWRFFLGGRFWGKKVKDKLSQIFLGWTP